MCGLALLAIYVHGVYLFERQVMPELFFWLFALIYSVSILLLWATARERRLVLAAVLVSASVIASLFFLRFYFYGTDFVEEYFTAQATRELGKWTPERVTGGTIWLDWQFVKTPTEILDRYFSTTSVTILPAMISEVTGLSTMQVLWLLVCIVSTAFVMIAFLIARICFGERIASLSSIILIFSSFYLGKFPTLLREDVALLFLVLALFCVLKGGKKNLVISLISLLVLPMSHYAMVYFAILFFLLLFLGSKIYEHALLKRFVQRINLHLYRDQAEYPSISGNLVIYTAVIGTVWLLFVAYPVFDANVGGLAGSLKALLGLSPSLSSYFQGHVVLSSLGPFHTAIQWLERILAISGFVLSLVTIRTKKAFLFVFAGAGLLAVALALAIVPNASSLFDLDRTMQIALLPFSIFIAVAVLKIYDTRHVRKLLAIFLVVLFLLETLQSPIMYTPASNLSRDSYIFSFSHIIAFYDVSDFQFAKWADIYTSNSSFFASGRNGHNLCLIANRMCVEPQGANVSDTIALLESGKIDYFLVLSYLNNYMSYTSKDGAQLELNSTEISGLLDNGCMNRIYDNSRVINFAYLNPVP
jgi:hypothetical protein